MPIKTMHKVVETLKQDKELIRIFAVSEHDVPKTPTDCNLDELLKPPAYRESVKELREHQKLGHFPRMRLYKRVEREWKAIPKSYPIPTPRR